MGASLSSVANTYVDWNRSPTRMIQFQENTTNGSGSGPIPSSFKGFEYDVFLSFRGEDTRYKFTSHLYKQLKDAGVQVYMDERRLTGGEDILPSLLKAIEKSRLSIPIFSQDYASSKSCLREVAKMNDCSSTARQIVLPVFYEIEPHDVRHQTGPFKKSFLQHRKDGVDSKDLDQWKKALQEIGFLKGYIVGRKVDEAELVEKIVSVVIKKLQIRQVPVRGNLVGMEQRVEAVVEKLCISSGGVRVVGICGMPGIGKTTLAKSVYNKLCVGFDGCSFISNIRENNILSLQTQLISDLSQQKFEKRDSCEVNKRIICNGFTVKKVLIVLDDVDNLDHFEAFGVSFQCFGPGSRIVLTTRNSELLACPEVAESYQVDCLSEPHALQLFCWHAFHKDPPEEGYKSLSDEIASKIGGNPSFVRSIGSRLHNSSKKEWIEVLQLLRNCKYPLMCEVLKTIYDGLTEEQKQIYLDIACFLRGESNTIASYMWEDCEFSPITTRKKLVGMSLLTIGENDEMQMDYPIGEYGKIVVLGADANPERRSRLWIHKDVLEVLKVKKGSDKIKAMCLQLDNGLETSPGFGEIPDPSPLVAENFANLNELRFLRMDRVKIRGNFENFLPKLRWLDWKNCPEISEDIQNLDLEKLVILDMSFSNVTHKWSCWNSIREKATNLKVLQLAVCNHLHESPWFPDCRQLQRLNFEGCSRLRSIRISSGTIETLVYLNIKGCRNITELPEGLSSMVALETLIIDETSVTKISFGRDMENLKHLSACACKALRIIDNSIGELKSLSYLALDDTAIEILPNSIGSLSRLQTLSLRNCKKVMKLPRAIGKLTSLVKMDFSYTAIEKLPPGVKDLKSLQDLVMAGTFLSKFPEHIAELKSLKNIDFSYCRCMEGRIPDDITSLSSLKTLKLLATKISSLPADISGLSQLQVLDLYMCGQLGVMPILPTSLTVLRKGPHM